MIPEYENPNPVGGTVEVSGTLCVTNSSGGTTIVRHGGVACRITKAFWDYETGWGYHGAPVEEADLAEIRRQAETGYGPDWYRANRPGDAEGLARAEAALAAFDPARVLFSEHDVAPAPAPAP